MATATVARTAQAIRNRRDPPRLSLSKRQSTMDGASDGPAAKKRKLSEPFVRSSAYILKKHQGKPPSLVIHLHQTHFRFDGQDGSFAYDSPMKFVVQHLRKETVPHEMLEELLANNVPFYDGCLIVEVHNHRATENKEKGHTISGSKPGDTIKFSMHNYNEHVTPSPMAPYPSKARTDATEPALAKEEKLEEKKEAKNGPKITTIVLHPTALTQHTEMLVLAKTPASEARGKKKGGDGNTSSATQAPPTPQLSVPPTPIGHTARGSPGQTSKMSLEEADFYSFQAEMLVATECPLFLEPVSNFQDSQKVLEMLQDSLHQESPPSLKTRKRTTAEMAADDAQAAELERRMLIMDERIKPSGTSVAANENQQAAASLGFSRFKTLEMVRQQLEEKERFKKEEDARLALEKKQQDELNAQNAQQAQQQRVQQQQVQRQLALAAQQHPNPQQAMMIAQRDQQMRARMAQQQAQMNGQNHGHAQANMMPNMLQKFAHSNQGAMVQGAMVQGSPVQANHHAMINSSPPMVQNGFAMTATSSQGPGSPARPTSAAMQRPNSMVRQVSQQQHPSRNTTPQMTQGTPNMAQAVPNRQMSQTPRMQPGSPATVMQQSTPTSATPQISNGQLANQNLTPEQNHLWQQRLQMGQAQAGMQAGSPQQSLGPESFQQMSNMQRQSMQRQLLAQQAAQAQAQGQSGFTPAQIAAAQLRQQQLLQQQRQQMINAQQHNPQMNGTPGQAGSPGQMGQQTPQGGHAHPQQQQDGQMTPQQQAAAQARAQQLAQFRQQQVQQVVGPYVQKYGSLMNIPANVIAAMPQHAQNVIRSQLVRQQQMRARQQQAQMQGTGQTQPGQEQVPGGTPNPQYMQQLRNNQAMLAARVQMAQQQQRQGSGGQVGAMPAGFNMNNMAMNQQFNNQQAGGQGGGNNNLAQHFAEMHNALNQNPQGGAGGVAGGGMQ